MAIQTASFLQDSVLFIRDTLRNNLTDPISSTRPSGQQYVLTAYPKRIVQYPIITCKSLNLVSKKLGMSSEIARITMDIEVRCWALNVKQLDDMVQDVINLLRSCQLDITNGTTDNKMYGFNLLSAVNVFEDGENSIKSKVLTFRYDVIIGE